MSGAIIFIQTNASERSIPVNKSVFENRSLIEFHSKQNMFQGT